MFLKPATTLSELVSLAFKRIRRPIVSATPDFGKRTTRMLRIGACLLVSIMFLAPAYGQEDLNNYKVRVSANWWYPHPSGTVYGKGNEGYFDLNKDFGFGYYSTFSVDLDWRFKKKHHFLLNTSSLDNSSTATLTRTIVFQGQTYNIGTSATAGLRTYSFAPAYQYDLISRNHGNLGLAAQFYLFDSKASLTGVTSVNNQFVTHSVSGSVFSPVPVIGPHGRWYPLHNSSRLSLDGYAQGMYFFGYGDFWAAKGAVNLALTRHLNLTGGYLLGSALSVHGTNDRIGLRLKQKGALVGIEGSW